MSKLNAGAYEFVPGRGFVASQQPVVQPPPPLERPEQTEAPRPPPTISLNIGAPKPQSPANPVHPLLATQNPASSPAPVTTLHPHTPSAPPAAKVTPVSTAPSKTFSTEKSKTDTNAIAQEVKAVADQAVLEDLFGSCMWIYWILSISLKST